MQFSKDGKYLAAGGQDMIVRVWQVLGTAEERAAHEEEEDTAGEGIGCPYSNGGEGMRLNAPVFRKEPIQEYSGHTADILDLSWSKVRVAYISLDVGLKTDAIQESIPSFVVNGQDG